MPLNLPSTPGPRRIGALVAVFLVCVAAPLFYVPYFYENTNVTKMFVLAFGALIPWLFALLGAFTGNCGLKKTALDPGIGALWMAMIASTALSIDIPISVLGQYQGQFHGLLPLAICTLVYYAVAKDELGAQKIGDIVLVGALIESGWALVQIAGYDSILGYTIQGGRASGTFGAPIFLGAYLALVLPLAWAWARGEGWRTYLGALAFVLAVWAIVACKGRGAGLAAGCGIAVYEWVRGNKSGVAITGVLGLIVLALWHPFHANSDLGRLEIWRAAFQGWRAYPWFGSGPDTFALLYQRFVDPKIVALYASSIFIQVSAHNEVLQILSTMGLIGLAAYAFFLLGAFGVAWRERLSNEGAAVLAVLVAVFVVAKFNPVHLTILAICAALLGSLDRSPHDGNPRRARTLMLAVLAIAVFGITRRQCRAAFYEKIGAQLADGKRYMDALRFFNMAAVENPWQIHYIERELNTLWSLSPSIDNGDMKKVAVISMLTTDYNVKLHPKDAIAHDMRALALKTLNMADPAKNTISESKSEMGEAIRLFPTFKGYVRDASQIAAQMGDKDNEDRLKLALKRIEDLESGK